MSLLHASDLIGELSDEVRECLFLPLLEPKQFRCQLPWAYIIEEVEFKFPYKMSKGAN